MVNVIKNTSAKSYWTTIKNRPKNEGSEVVTKCDHLKRFSRDGKIREIDVINILTICPSSNSSPKRMTKQSGIWELDAREASHLSGYFGDAKVCLVMIVDRDSHYLLNMKFVLTQNDVVVAEALVEAIQKHGWVPKALLVKDESLLGKLKPIAQEFAFELTMTKKFKTIPQVMRNLNQMLGEQPVPFVPESNVAPEDMLFDDCEVCQAQKKALLEGREITQDELGAAMQSEGAGRYPVVNARRKKRMESFTDKDHPVMDEYYELLESPVSGNVLKKEMEALIADDPDFYDPYIIVADLEIEEGHVKEGMRLIQQGFERAVMRIADAHGDWPMEMRWGYMENRHVMRMIQRFAVLVWDQGMNEMALDIFRRLLRANVGDNQGARHSILAIRMGLGSDWDEPFVVHDGPMAGEALDAIAVSEWFEQHVKDYPDEFGWWFERMKEMNG